MQVNQLIPNKPKQKRSLDRYELILDAVEEILINEGIHSVNIQKVKIVEKMKRNTIYKMFPSNEYLFNGMSERNIENFSKLVIENAK